MPKTVPVRSQGRQAVLAKYNWENEARVSPCVQDCRANAPITKSGFGPDPMPNGDKSSVRDFWNAAACGETLYLRGITKDDYEEHARIRYALEPEILWFADFARWRGKSVLEIGVGLGADHSRFAAHGAVLTGIDLTERAVAHTRARMETLGFKSRIEVADAEDLPFADETFDLVYSWGVLHHSPDAARCVHEAYRVLKPGGTAKIMIYHKYSMVGYMLWIRYGLLQLRPFTPLQEIYSRHLESPGTQAYTVAEVRKMFSVFRKVEITPNLSHGDLLTSDAGQRHRGILLTIARKIWPRWFITRFMKTHGLEMMITARK
jgi:SAM-dependent methyltransferase